MRISDWSSDVCSSDLALFGGHRPECRRQLFSERRNPNPPGLQFDMSRLDFRNIENVIDEQEKVIARCFNRFGMLHLIVAEIAIPIVREQPCHDQKRIERLPKIMRTVCEE